MLPVFSLCLLLLVNTCAAYSDNEVGITVSTQCVDNDALTKETYAAIESAIKVSQYSLQTDKLKALARLEKHVAHIRPIILAEEQEKKKEKYADCVDLKESGVTASGVYTIYPAGSEPLEVFCDMTTGGGGWTVFQRRQDGTENFDRVFEDYNQGFGDNDGEFWLGNDALRNLTATGESDLRVDMWDWNSSYKYATYTGFMISGEDYRLSFNEESYAGNAGDSLTFHNGWGFTARDHDVDGAEGNCAEWLYSGWWFNWCHRSNLNGHYKNELDAIDGQTDQGIQWTSWKGFQYSLQKTEMKFRRSQKTKPIVAANCMELMRSGITLSGTYTITPLGMKTIDVYCDMVTDGGGWTVFQRRKSGLKSFDTGFDDFAKGFGEPGEEFWLGNYALKNMTDYMLGAFELRVDMWDWNGIYKFAQYTDFYVTGEDFTLNIGTYTGDAGDSLRYHNGMGFTTRDHDVDGSESGNCAVWLYSGWWFNACHRANLNGRYKNQLDAVDGQRDQGIQWTTWKGFNYSLMKTEMKFRPM